MNASTLLDFFNHLGKSPTDTGASSNGAGGGSSGGRFSSLNGTLDRVSVKEEPLSEEDLRALQKDRQKKQKDNHNMSMYYTWHDFSREFFSRISREKFNARNARKICHDIRGKLCHFEGNCHIKMQ